MISLLEDGTLFHLSVQNTVLKEIEFCYDSASNNIYVELFLLEWCT